MSKQEITKNPLLGCFEIALFMKDGVQRFNSDFSAMLRSFAVAALNIPLLLVSMPYVYAAKENLQTSPISLINLLFIAKVVIVMALGLSLVYLFCHITHRKQHFLKYITVANWSALIGIVLFVPIIIFLHYGLKTYDELYPVIILLGIYSYAYATFVLKHVLQIPWELSVFLMVCLMAINETCFDILYWLATKTL